MFDLAVGGMTIEKCISLAYSRFYYLFRDMILSLVRAGASWAGSSFRYHLPSPFRLFLASPLASTCWWRFPAQIERLPLDAVTGSLDAVPGSGDKFWSGTKRFPTPLSYDPSNEYHVMFVTATANILAAAFGIVPPPETYVPLLGSRRQLTCCTDPLACSTPAFPLLPLPLLIPPIVCSVSCCPWTTRGAHPSLSMVSSPRCLYPSAVWSPGSWRRVPVGFSSGVLSLLLHLQMFVVVLVCIGVLRVAVHHVGAPVTGDQLRRRARRSPRVLPMRRSWLPRLPS